MLLIAAAILLLLPLGFVAVNVLQYELGVPVPWNPYGNLYDQISGTSWTYLFDTVIFLSPILALALVAFSQIRISGGDGKVVLSWVKIHQVPAGRPCPTVLSL